MTSVSHDLSSKMYFLQTSCNHTFWAITMAPPVAAQSVTRVKKSLFASIRVDFLIWSSQEVFLCNKAFADPLASRNVYCLLCWCEFCEKMCIYRWQEQNDGVPSLGSCDKILLTCDFFSGLITVSYDFWPNLSIETIFLSIVEHLLWAIRSRPRAPALGATLIFH